MQICVGRFIETLGIVYFCIIHRLDRLAIPHVFYVDFLHLLLLRTPNHNACDDGHEDEEEADDDDDKADLVSQGFSSLFTGNIWLLTTSL